MSELTKLDELIRRVLPTEALPDHLRPSHLLDDAVEPPSCVAEQVYALRQLVQSGGRQKPLTGRLASSRNVAEHFTPRLRDRPTESVWVAGLDAKNRVLMTRCVGQGGATASALEPRDVLRPLVLNNATALILVHNHPSGDPAPSSEDAAITRRLKQAAALLGIHLLDHVIIGAEGYFSFLDAGLL